MEDFNISCGAYWYNITWLNCDYKQVIRVSSFIIQNEISAFCGFVEQHHPKAPATWAVPVVTVQWGSERMQYTI